MMPTAKKLQSLRWLTASALLRFGLPLKLYSPDRALLERQILPHFATDDDFSRVLFVGCDWYTKWYERLFDAKNYVTIEIEPQRRRFGAKRHIVGSLADLGQHFAPHSLDLIVCNGVFGWGLDTQADSAKAFAECATALRPAGVLVLGWDDVPEHKPFDPIPLLQRNGFRPWIFPPLGTARETVGRHVYDFFAAPAG